MRRVRRSLPGRRDRDGHMTEVHPIEVESYRILRSRIDLSALPPMTRAVTERIIHAAADFDYVTALVIGVPVGFVGAADAKDNLRASGLPALSNVSEKGGSAVAVAAFNALLRIASKPVEESL